MNLRTIKTSMDISDPQRYWNLTNWFTALLLISGTDIACRTRLVDTRAWHDTRTVGGSHGGTLCCVTAAAAAARSCINLFNGLIICELSWIPKEVCLRQEAATSVTFPGWHRSKQRNINASSDIIIITSNAVHTHSYGTVQLHFYKFVQTYGAPVNVGLLWSKQVNNTPGFVCKTLQPPKYLNTGILSTKKNWISNLEYYLLAS